MSKKEDQTSPIFTAVRSAGVLRKNERAIDRILRVLVFKTTVTEDDLKAVQNILDSNIMIRRAGGSTEILSVASAFGRNDLFIRVYLAISPARVEPEALVMLTDPTRLHAVWDPAIWTGEVVANSAAQNLVQIVYSSPSLSLTKAEALEEALQSRQRQGRPCPRVGTVAPPPFAPRRHCARCRHRCVAQASALRVPHQHLPTRRCCSPPTPDCLRAPGQHGRHGRPCPPLGTMAPLPRVACSVTNHFIYVNHAGPEVRFPPPLPPSSSNACAFPT
jgi:hypothetical protein